LVRQKRATLFIIQVIEFRLQPRLLQQLRLNILAVALLGLRFLLTHRLPIHTVPLQLFAAMPLPLLKVLVPLAHQFVHRKKAPNGAKPTGLFFYGGIEGASSASPAAISACSVRSRSAATRIRRVMTLRRAT
jgi:hypothetical protein